MTDPLALLWAVLEAPDPVIALSAWNRLPAISKSQLDQSGLVVPHQCDEIVCSACDLHHRSPVLELESSGGPPRHIIACPVEGQVDLTHEQRLTRSIEVCRVVESIATALDLEGQTYHAAGDRLMFCGYARHHGQRVEVYLGRGLARRDGRGIVDSLPKSPLPQVVWVPLSRPLDGVWDTQKPPAVLTLAGMTRLDPGGLVVVRDIFESTVREVVLSRAHPEHMFVKGGDGWNICFRGSQPVIVKDTKGMGYIARLLEFPVRPVAAASLHLEGSGLDPVVLSGSKGGKMDEQALAEYRALRVELVEKLREARRVGDFAVVPSLEEQVQAINDELRGAIDIRGEIRQCTDKEAARTSVSSAIGVAVRSISEKDAELGRHLKASIKKGNDCVYKPDEPIDWVL